MVDEAAILQRFQEFEASSLSKPYQRQKSALEKQLCDFLSSVSPPKSISSCCANDIVKFLIDKDRCGKTVVHSMSCSKQDGCGCPRRLAAGTIDSLLGKLRAIFNNIGRLNDSNPVAHPRVKHYLKFSREEQAGLAVTPTQAVPIFFVKFRQLVTFLRDLIGKSDSLSRVDKYILVRDTLFFVIDFFTGDRASDLGRLLTSQVFKLRDREGYLLKFSLTKNLRKGASRPFVLVPYKEPDVCPVAWLGYYLRVCHLLEIRLAQGYFFRATNRDKSISDRPLVGSAVNNRLRKYLTDASLLSGETPHSFRVGLSNTLRMLGCSQEEIAQYLGWQSREMAKHYTRLSDTEGALSVLEGVVVPGTASLSQIPVSHPSNLSPIL